jgi:hypothetical protein
MLKITNTTFSMISCEKSKQLRSTTELMKIKERIERQTEKEQHRYKEHIAEMFLAGPLAWPDYPECEDMDWEEEEEWIPLDFDASSAGE